VIKRIYFALQMRQWIKESQEDLVSNFSEVGNDENSSSELQQEHQNIQNSCNVSVLKVFVYLVNGLFTGLWRDPLHCMGFSKDLRLSRV
jgi:hypothetical protein